MSEDSEWREWNRRVEKMLRVLGNGFESQADNIMLSLCSRHDSDRYLKYEDRRGYNVVFKLGGWSVPKQVREYFTMFHSILVEIL